MRDREIRIRCFLFTSLFSIPLCIWLFIKRAQWFARMFYINNVYLIVALGLLIGLVIGLVIGTGLIANLLISYAHSLEQKLGYIKAEPEPVAAELSPEEHKDRWEEYGLHIELYKFYLDTGLKANLFFYLITGGILGFYFTSAKDFRKFSLLLPILISLAFGGVFIHGAILWTRVSRIIRGIRRELKIKKAPDIHLLTVLLIVFGIIFLTIGAAMILLVIFTH